MEVRIEWSALSDRQLKDIFDYYAIEASPRVAGKLIDNIIDRASILKDNP
jgi:plasmid stabilization system protein ParE